MPYTFGAATSDRISAPLPDALFAVTEISLVYGWFLPTTLTATRKYFGNAGGAGNDCGLEVDTTTSELRFKNPNSTTKAEYTTSGAGIVTDKWQFIAMMAASGVAPRFWVGTVETPPAEVSSAQVVAPAGGGTTGTAIVIGNTAAGSPAQAFQGDIAEMGGVHGGTSTQAPPFFLASASAITQTEADFTLRRLILPAWVGENIDQVRQGLGAGTPARYFYWNVVLNSLPASYCSNRTNATTQPGVACTVTGATVSQNGHPRGRSDMTLHRRIARYW